MSHPARLAADMVPEFFPPGVSQPGLVGCGLRTATEDYLLSRNIELFIEASVSQWPMSHSPHTKPRMETWPGNGIEGDYGQEKKEILYPGSGCP